ncbi:glutamate racemase [Caldimonas brevitalea]|uniref:Glutamate racemase n=1 Tax=Caldimonas brevitalea TaxID=413882 RepID=A0A0G3BGY6_9BURK|nr:glutamate racemase [Caldimonas brevitalea]AKJ28602.1 glutamate racemase [Caldimonas brevitalea]
MLPTPGAAATPPIGVFDSGVGGLSVLRAVHRLLPGVPLHYVADSGYAPYGERGDDYVIARSRHLTEFFRSAGARVIVIACNTATAAASRDLRERYPDTAFVGVEPGLKPAVGLSHNGQVGVLATGGTLRSEKFRKLLASFEGQARFHLQPCPGLAHAIEQGDLASAALRDLVASHCQPLREAGVDTVVLGCTHYPFVAPLIQQALGPGVRLIDTAEPVARQTVTQFVKMHGALPERPVQPVRAYTSGEVAVLQRIAAQWLDFDVAVQALP